MSNPDSLYRKKTTSNNNPECFGGDFHKFEPRYDTVESVDQEALTKLLSIPNNTNISMNGVAKLETRYVCDICIHCGYKVDRNNK